MSNNYQSNNMLYRFWSKSNNHLLIHYNLKIVYLKGFKMSKTDQQQTVSTIILNTRVAL